MRGPRLGGHPVHPILTDFPMALLSVVVLWDVVGLVVADGPWAELAFWTLLVGVVALVPTAVTGFLDFLALPRESPAVSTAIWHMAAVLVAGTLFTASLLLRGGPGPDEGTFGVAQVVALIGALVLIVGGRLGGALVFRHGVGRSDEQSREAGLRGRHG